MYECRVNHVSDSSVISDAYRVFEYPSTREDLPEFGVDQQKLFDVILDHLTQRAKKNDNQRN